MNGVSHAMTVKLKAWMLNVVLVWDSDSLSDLEPKNRSTSLYNSRDDFLSHYKIKTGKAAGLSGIIVKMTRSDSKEIVKSITNLANRIIKAELFLQIGNFHIFSVYTRVKVMLSLETITEV